MQIPASFAGTREQLKSACTPCAIMALSSYMLPTLTTSAAGSEVLANAILDTTRIDRPSAFNALILSVVCDTPNQLAHTLSAFNQVCPINVFVNAANYASSLSTIDTVKMQLPISEQSYEWQKLDDCRFNLAFANAYQDKSLALVVNEGANLIGAIDDELSSLKQKKSERDQRLTNQVFTAASGVNAEYVATSSANALAQHIKTLGNNAEHWAYCAFVGSADELKVYKEMFL
ncbi:hypothetical protein [Pseudoalteromonas ruthenica]|uniref:hypothetical protein n=1 Tax=Pseudoalteromonas ruthenica TaxID=151081 RepID=UPI00110AB924|nr:hypothetical protein [Pseudoalteromonas ruthenica]TMO97537.1 hypothetical protein CWC07_13735 [Pseudoalteromonas ruthenica]